MASSDKPLMNKKLLNLEFHAAQDKQNTVYAPINILVITVTEEVCSVDSLHFQEEHDGDYDKTVNPTKHD